MVEIKLDSKNLETDDLFSFDSFIQDIDIEDLYILNKMITDEMNKRIQEVYDSRFKD